MFPAYVIDFFQDSNTILVLKIFYYTFPVWFPLALLSILWELWLRYIRALFFAKQEYILLEIKLPRELFKSPQAMEFFVAGLYTMFGEANWYEKYWNGSVRAWFSLEIVSIDGQVHFFIWGKKGFKHQIEANLYSQFPGIEIFEVPDYTLSVIYNPEVNAIFATEFDLKEKDFFPIKTYIDYELDKNPKEEFKIDPLTPLIEAMGTLPKGHQAWIQIIIQAHSNTGKDPKTGKPADMKWKKAAQAEIEAIIKRAKGEVGADGKTIPGTGRYLTDTETTTIKALERSVSKVGFDVGMRFLYTAPKDVFSFNYLGGLIGGVMHFNSPLNGFKTARGSAPKYRNFFLAWKDRSIKRINREKQRALDAYKRRAYFHRPYKSPPFVLNTEEIATLFHFPGGVSATPTFTRVESRKAEAPTNLPV